MELINVSFYDTIVRLRILNALKFVILDHNMTQIA